MAAAGFAEQEELSSSLTARAFYDAGFELYTNKPADFFNPKQAVIFFSTGLNLDKQANYILPDIINLAWQCPQENLSDVVQTALKEYIGNSSDLEITSKAVQYLLEKRSSREEREQLLQKLLDQYGQENQFFASDLSAQLGFLKAETADTAESQRYLMLSYVSNKYDRLAFGKLAELAETGGEKLPDIVYLSSLRFAVRANPLDLESAVNFARDSESLGLYSPAAAGYKYCAQLYNYLNAGKPLPAEFYRPWMLNGFNSQDYSLCHKIAEQVRGYGVFDVMVEAIAAASAKEGGDIQGYQSIINSIKERAGKILAGQIKASDGEIEDFAWFFSLAAEANDANSQDALAWATKAYSDDNNSVSAGSFLAYALVKSNQLDLAKAMLEKIGTGTQTSAIAKAEISAAGKDANSAIKMFKTVVDAAPGTFESRKAKIRLKELGSEYVPAIDPAVFITALKNDFGQMFFAEFVPPEKMITAEIKTSGSAFSYGSEINAELAIKNNYSEPMVVCPDGIFKGNVRVDVRITGDLSERIDNFIVKTVRPSAEINPHGALFVPLRLATGRLKTIMDCYPQADLNMEITVYMDPQVGSDGQIRNFYGMKPAKTILKRRKLELNTDYLQQRFDILKKGQQGQKIKSAQLFAGLLAEQQNLSGKKPKYKLVYVEPELLSSALAVCMTGDDWILKVQTMAAMQKFKLDYRLTESVSAQLDNRYWPVRLMAMFILAENQRQDFLPVLKWMAEKDGSSAVKDMAAALSAGIMGIPDKVTDVNVPATSPEKPAEKK